MSSEVFILKDEVQCMCILTVVTIWDYCYEPIVIYVTSGYKDFVSGI